MTANLPTPTSRGTLTSAPPLEAKLVALVQSGDNPVVGPVTAGKLRLFSDQPEPALITRDEFDVMYAKLALVTLQANAQVDAEDDEADERINLYWLALKDLPGDDLRAAFVDLLRTAKFLPTPAEIHKVAAAKGMKRRHAKSRARHLVWLHDRDWKPAAETIAPEELAGLLAAAKVATDVPAEAVTA